MKPELREVTRIKEPQTLLEGKPWIKAETHSDPSNFRFRMEQYRRAIQPKNTKPLFAK
jgi:hypothetical protein